jgi:hypothetical protein
MHAKGKLSAALYRFEKKNFSLLWRNIEEWNRFFE